MPSSRRTALIGSTGFVGSSIQRQASFTNLYSSTNIDTIRGQSFDLVVCAGAPGQKWRANKNPEADRLAIELLQSALAEVEASVVVLISTVDVFKIPIGVDERSDPASDGLAPYGRHRLGLEQFVASTFPRTLVVRLPALVGPGLRKNALFDLKHRSGVDQIDWRSQFQFYPVVNLWKDIGVAINSGIGLVHLAVEPLEISVIAREIFGVSLDQEYLADPLIYNVSSVYADVFGASGNYQYAAREAWSAIEEYAKDDSGEIAS